MAVHNMSILRVGSLNCEGLNDYYKRLALFEYLKLSQLAIIFLQETKLKPENELQYQNEWHNKKCIFNSTVGGKSGTAILFNLDMINILPNKFIDVEGRVIAVDVEIFGNVFHLLNSYGPNKYGEKVPFLNRLYLYANSNNPIVWAGDHNIATDPFLDRYPTSLASDHGTREFMDI